MADLGDVHVYDGDYASLPVELTAWIGAPPDLWQDGALVYALITDLVELLHPYGLYPTIYTGEPRNYRRTPKGLAQLEQAVLQRRADFVSIITPAWVPKPGPISDQALASISMMSREFPGSASKIEISIRPTRRSEFPLAASRVTDFVIRWFAPLRAAAAFVSATWYARRNPVTRTNPSLGDHATGTAFERDGRLHLGQWEEITRFGRGAFWGTGLGPDLCARLGGQARVLAQAPVPIARPLDGGVWLQLPSVPPAAPADLARLASYLEPILSWNDEEVWTLRKEAQARRRAEEAARFSEMAPSVVAETILREAEERGQGPTRGKRKAVPIRGLDRIDVDVTLNLRLSGPLTPVQQALVESVVDGWYRNGFDGAYQIGPGSGGFHSLSRPSVDGPVLRWHVDLGTADGTKAIHDLAKRLGNVPDVTVRRLDLGTEEVG